MQKRLFLIHRKKMTYVIQSHERGMTVSEKIRKELGKSQERVKNSKKRVTKQT